VVYPYETTLQGSPTAHYTYQAPNVGNPALNPLLASCDDPVYGGPMKKISYTYATDVNSDNSTVVFGQIQSENSGTTGQPVTSLGFVVSGRAETRADRSFRNFLYGNGQIANSSDFYFHFAAQGYDSTTGFVNSTTDRNEHTTDIVSDPISGNITQVTFPLTPNDTPPGTPRGQVSSVYGGNPACGDSNTQEPYYLCSSTDEGGHLTTYWRDTNKRVAQINYPDGGYETFSYNSFGEIETHRMTSGGIETFTYDSNNGLKQTYRDPDHDPINQTANPTARYQYDALGRLHGVTDARGGYSGDPAHTTTTDYNQRGQVTTLTHPGGSFITYGYDAYGNRTLVRDELSHGTIFDYDDYGRVIKVTDPLTHFTTISYAPWSGIGSYSHTTNSVYRITSPLLKLTDFDYDANFRRAYVRKGSGSVDDDGGTYFGYDYAGNLTSVRDPRQNTTTFAYDERNRRASVTDALTHPTAIEYDAAGHPAKTIRADSSYSRAEYDSMNRVIDTYGFANEHTHYERDAAGNIRRLVDPKPATYLLDYDTMNRKRGITYPVDATGVSRSETWRYDIAGNMDQYTNPAGQIKTLGYDTRNRFINSSWNAGGGPALGLGYYDNSQLGIIVTNNGETTVVFGYDDANRQTWEEQTVAGFPTRRVETPRDSDGNRSSLNVPGWYALQYDYTQRNQLWHIKDGGGTQWFTYTYDLAGNMTKRQDVFPGGVNDSLNIPSANYDAINRPTLWENTGAGDAWFARSHYQYDNLNREVATWRDEQGGKGEWFGYDPTGQLTGVSYNADGVSSGNPQNASRTVSYTPTADKLNRSSMNDNGDVSDYTPNALNQYENVAGGSFSYDGNFNLTGTGGFYATYNSANQATSIYGGEDEGDFVYDGLGRCVKRTVDWETTLITYDGWKPIVEWDAWDNFLAWNVYGFGADEILWRHHISFGDLRYHSDRHGNIIALLDNNGNGIEKYTYDAFGDPEVTDWSGDNERDGSWYGNRFMFQGREYIAELGLYDFRNRFYYPELGRFLQSDPMGFGAGDNNLFRYCGGDPVNRNDPTGFSGATVTVDGDTVNITLPIAFSGPMFGPSGATPGVISTFVSGIQSMWTGKFGTYNVTTSVELGGGNYIRVYPGSGTSGTEIGGPTGFWYAGGSNGTDAGYVAAHEAGHLMGLLDRFRWVNGFMLVEPGYEGNIMGGFNGVPSAADVAAIIKANTPNVFGRIWNSIVNLFSGSANLGSYPTLFVSGYSQTIPETGNWIYGGNDAPPGSIVGNINGHDIVAGGNPVSWGNTGYFGLGMDGVTYGGGRITEFLLHHH
jgi:RHS repeat-associated protein